MKERAYKKYIYKQREKRFFCVLEEMKCLKLRKRLKIAYCILFKKGTEIENNGRMESSV